jgi:hypothetical protein
MTPPPTFDSIYTTILPNLWAAFAPFWADLWGDRVFLILWWIAYVLNGIGVTLRRIEARERTL